MARDVTHHLEVADTELYLAELALRETPATPATESHLQRIAELRAELDALERELRAPGAQRPSEP